MQFSQYALDIIKQYRQKVPILLKVSIGFTGVVNEQPGLVYTPEVGDGDILLLDANVDFSNSGVLVQVADSNGYFWSKERVPISAVAGFQTQVTPCLPLPIEYLLLKKHTLQLDFRNSPSSATTGGNITFRGIKLLT
jgi:hypothetical protein